MAAFDQRTRTKKILTSLNQNRVQILFQTLTRKRQKEVSRLLSVHYIQRFLMTCTAVQNKK